MELRPYQDELATKAVQTVKAHGLAYLAMEPRTGKTLTALTAADRLGASKVLFVSKKMALPSIVADFDKGGFQFQFKATNFEQVHNAPSKPDLLIVDEAHSLGAFPKPSLRAKRLREKYFDIPTIYLSGTPTPESYSQVYHQFWVNCRSPFSGYKNFYRWADDFVIRHEKHLNGYSLIDYSDAREDAIKRYVEPVMISYTQQEAGFNCPVHENFLVVDDPVIPPLIRGLFKQRVLDLNGCKVVADSPAKLMSKLHQLSGGTVICEDGAARIVSRAKAEFIKRQFAGQRIAIFYKFVAELDILRDAFGMFLTNDPEQFQNNRDMVFASQILSGREGIALHEADAIVFYNIDYSATSYWQARARLQSLNRTAPAEIYWVMTRGGIEKTVYKAVQAKQDFTLSYFMRQSGVSTL